MKIRLTGEKVILRDLEESDIPTLYYWNYEAEDREHLNWNGPYKDVEEKTYEEFYKEHLPLLETAKSSEIRNKLVIEVNGALIGTVGWYWVDQDTNWLENGIVIYDSEYWSGGYGTEAFRLWTDYIFEQSDVERVGIATWSGNERMMRLASKTGMKEEGRIRKARIVKGAYYDSIKMGMLREEWAQLRKAISAH
ncbi:GNAT family N-acetyltransferase [Fictibacillus sp. WQ 8-8]|uniref:GNAT family N-acetyltransferase n=1 Tax=Fictibacillus sp. WQ 8-8 TaxID=2938788 RepID=UPI00210EC05F|nr:GNAT family protein [Fictibacillus sp. WQ 8-8]MCQ6267498.1 GNAT family N-acetyltransferase [Fictibacillus sp. WQ 8-8]